MLHFHLSTVNGFLFVSQLCAMIHCNQHIVAQNQAILLVLFCFHGINTHGNFHEQSLSLKIFEKPVFGCAKTVFNESQNKNWKSAHFGSAYTKGGMIEKSLS